MSFKIVENLEAKRYIRNLFQYQKFNWEVTLNFNQWLQEAGKVKCYLLLKDDKLVTLALLSKCDYDEYEGQSNPYICNYIYTFENYRRKGYGLQLLEFLKSKEQLTAICSCDESEKLFQKAKFINHGLDKIFHINPVYRYP